MKFRGGKSFGAVFALLAAAGLLFGAVFTLPRELRAEAAGAVAAVQNGADDPTGRAEFSTLSAALEKWTAGKCLVLLQNCSTQNTIEIPAEEERELLLGKNTLALKAGGEGSVLSVNGTLVLSSEEGGMITGGDAQRGGGIDIGAKGTLDLSGGVKIENNRAKEGGGIYCGGKLILSGAVKVLGNFGAGGKDDNIFLTHRNLITLRDFKGQVGVGVASEEEMFAQGFGEGDLIPDDKNYMAEQRAEGYFLVPAPLAFVQAEYLGEGKIFPKTQLETLKKGIMLSGVNANGAPYEGEIGPYTLSAPEDVLKIGKNEITLTTESGIATTFTVEVVKPALVSLSAAFSRSGKIYADSPLEEICPYLTVTGTYEDGLSREIHPTAEETARACGEDYIDEFYTLSGDLKAREGDTAKVKVLCGEIEIEAEIKISRRYLDVSSFSAQEVSMMRGDTPEGGAFAFLPGFQEKFEGVVPEPKIGGEAFAFSELPSGVYAVEISFRLENERDFELSDGTVQTRLLVYSEYFEGKSGDVMFRVLCEGGISPEWDFTLTDSTQEEKTDPGDGLKIERSFLLTFFPGQSGTKAKNFQVRLFLPDSLLDEELTLLCTGEGEALKEIAFTRKGDTSEGTLRSYLEFEAEDLLEVRLIFASDSHVTLYVILAVCFGVLCAAGAGVLVWYFVRKKKLKLRE